MTARAYATVDARQGCRTDARRRHGQALSTRQRAEQLVNTYADLILRLSYTYLHSTHDAEDICQEVLLKVINRQRGFESVEHERAWVVRVTANACRDLLRRQKAHRTVALEEVAEPMAAQQRSEADEEVRGKRVLAAVMSLPVMYREAIYLRYYEGHSIREVALETGRSESAVSTNLSRGRAKLREILKGEYDDFDA